MLFRYNVYAADDMPQSNAEDELRHQSTLCTTVLNIQGRVMILFPKTLDDICVTTYKVPSHVVRRMVLRHTWIFSPDPGTSGVPMSPSVGATARDERFLLVSLPGQNNSDMHCIPEPYVRSSLRGDNPIQRQSRRVQPDLDLFN